MTIDNALVTLGNDPNALAVRQQSSTDPSWISIDENGDLRYRRFPSDFGWQWKPNATQLRATNWELVWRDSNR
jgi:hypothetical protein